MSAKIFAKKLLRCFRKAYLSPIMLYRKSHRPFFCEMSCYIRSNSWVDLCFDPSQSAKLKCHFLSLLLEALDFAMYVLRITSYDISSKNSLWDLRSGYNITGWDSNFTSIRDKLYTIETDSLWSHSPDKYWLGTHKIVICNSRDFLFVPPCNHDFKFASYLEY